MKIREVIQGGENPGMQIVWEGNWLSPNGHATVCRNMTAALTALGVDVKLRTTERVSIHRHAAYLRNRYLSMLQRPYKPSQERVRIIHRAPPDFRREDDLLTIGAAYAEATAVPTAWVSTINREVDVLMVASQHSLQAFQASGVTRPIWVVRHGVNRTHALAFKSHPIRWSKLTTIPDFRFLSVFEWVPRKGYDILLQAFWEEFNEQEDVCLVLKTRSFTGMEDTSIFHQIRALKREYGHTHSAPVYVCTEPLTEMCLMDLYHAASVFVLATRGEGIGLPLLEAAAIGLPVIATGWGGQTEFLPARLAHLVQFTLEPVPVHHDNPRAESLVGWWAHPDVMDLRRHLRQVYAHPTRAYRQAARLRREILDHWTWNISAYQLLRHIWAYLGQTLNLDGKIVPTLSFTSPHAPTWKGGERL